MFDQSSLRPIDRKFRSATAPVISTLLWKVRKIGHISDKLLAYEQKMMNAVNLKT